ncbi:MAG: hypothetical protein ACRERC_05220 [Candidatus Binatia bacterium]
MTSYPLRAALLSALLATALFAQPARAFSFRILNVGKVAELTPGGGSFSVRGDRALQPLLDPTCPTVSRVDVSAYLQSTARNAILATETLDCTKWRFRSGTWRYENPAGIIRAIRYSKRGLRMQFGGAGYTPVDGAVGYIQAQLVINDVALRIRHHNFDHNDALLISTRRPSGIGALGESAFWDVLNQIDHSEANQQKTLTLLRKAARRDPGDGRSRFLLAMTHLYRFGQQVVTYDNVSEAARADARAAVAWFDEALPLLWDSDTLTGDSRVIGFVGAAKFSLGIVENDAAMQAEGLAVLDVALQVNAFFNVFDLIPVIQALPPSDPRFTAIYNQVLTYLEDPETLACVGTQPELCANTGMAPTNISGALTLFGDMYAKGGDLGNATRWYTLANALTPATWPFKPILTARLADVAGRIALYQDADLTNDPPIIGAGAENCAVCHTRP